MSIHQWESNQRRSVQMDRQETGLEWVIQVTVMGHCWCSWCKLLCGCVCWGLDQGSKYICWLKNANLWHTEFAEWKLSTTTFCRARGMTMHLSSRARLLYMDSLWRTSQNYQRWLGAVWLRLAGKSNFVILRRS